tara:strand:+ start:389 stop:712 length:324 start_codon:yes stop_codon:yes gene_type:complete
MGLKQKYIGAKYKVEDFFIDSLQELDLYTALKIARYIERNLDSLPPNNMCSYILGGVIVDTIGDPITFALEIVSDKNKSTTLTDVTLITMDEYLDLINLNCYIKNSK